MKKFMAVGLSYIVLLVFIFVLLGKVSDLRSEHRNLMEDIYGESKNYMLVNEPLDKTYLNPYGTFLNDGMADFITECCHSFGVDPNLVVAVLEMENPSLNVSAVSKPNENGTRDVGLFQLNDRALYSKDGFLDKYWNPLLGEFNPDNWKNNAYVAVKLLDDLERMFGKGNVYWIACAYNAGPSRAYREWTKTDDKSYLPERTRDYYAPMVVNNWKKWNALIPQDGTLK